jgi:hypothetical protein
MLSSPHTNPDQTVIEQKIVGLRLLLYILPILLAAGCATKRAGNEGPKSAFTQNTVALMIMPTFEDAEALRLGNAAGDSCELTDKESQTLFQKIDEIGGTALIGLLAIGLTVLLVALPFIL